MAGFRLCRRSFRFRTIEFANFRSSVRVFDQILARLQEGRHVISRLQRLAESAQRDVAFDSEIAGRDWRKS